MKRIGSLLCLGMLIVSGSVFAAPDLSENPAVKVPVTSPSYNLVQKKDGFGAQMYWSKKPHAKELENVFIQAAIKDSAMNVKDSENLAYFMTDLIDEGLRIVTLEKTPYIKLKEKSTTLSDLSAEIKKYDAGLLFFVDNQKNGEVGLHVFLKDTQTGQVFGHYTSRVEYDVTKGMDAKKEAFVRGVKSFARELKMFRTGKHTVSETIYQL